MLKRAFAFFFALFLGSLAQAQVEPFPPDCKTMEIASNGTTLHVRVGGAGPAVVLVLIDAPIPGVGPWDEILENPLLWHFRFGGPDMERLVAGRERISLDRFWNEFSATPLRFTKAARQHYAAPFARPGAMHSSFAQFAAFDQDAIDNRAFLAQRGELAMPVLALDGEKSFGRSMAAVMRFAATDVSEDVVPDSGHWIMEEKPRATIGAIRAFLVKKT